MNMKNKLNIANPAHAYLFTGQDVVEVANIAKQYAKTWLCNFNLHPCNTCKSCVQFDSSNHPDFSIIHPEGNSIKIGQARELIEKIIEKPIESEKKVFIINDADKMTLQAQNCLLKVLEEPPLYGIIILVSSNEQAFLDTIKSRCIKINFNLKPDNNSLYKNQLVNEKDNQINQIINSINQVKKVEMNKLSKELLAKKDDISILLEYINELIYFKAQKDFNYINGVDIVNNAIRKLRMNCNIEMTIDSMSFQLWEVINEKYCRG